MSNKIEVMVNYAYQFIKTPYIWGGAYPTGYDCSGFIQEILASVGWDLPGDQTAQALFDAYKTKWPLKIDKGSLLFFGKDHQSISHVSLAIDEEHMIESGGGNSKTTSIDVAKKQNAFIRIRPIANRSDLILGLYPSKEYLYARYKRHQISTQTML